MTEQDQFLGSGESPHSMEELEECYSEHVRRAQGLEAQRLSYNEQAREALQQKDSGSGQYFLDLHNVAKDMSSGEYNKALAYRVEIDMRKRNKRS